MRSFVVSLVVASLVLAAGAASAASRPRSCCPDPGVEQTWLDLSGHRLSLDALRGRVVVVNFWASWCAPCVKELPDLVELQERFGVLGVQIVAAGADLPAERDAVLDFARSLELDFPVVLGATTAQMEALGLPPVLPGTVVLDREGHVVERFPGVFDPRKLAAAVERALGDHDQPAEHRHVHVATGAGAVDPSLVPS